MTRFLFLRRVAIFFAIVMALWFFASMSSAQTQQPAATLPLKVQLQIPRKNVQTTPSSPSAQSQLATQSAESTPSAIIQEKQTIDITQNTEVKSKLSAYLESIPTEELSPFNVVRHAMRNAIAQGIPANILVLLLLFPVTATLIAVFRHIIGFRGFGVNTPAVLAVAFVSTGIVKGLIIFTLVFVSVLLGKEVINRMKLQYIPRAALLLWFVSAMVFGLLLASPYLPFGDLASIGIFPLLMIILLSENFMDAHVTSTIQKALQLTFETVILAILSALFMRTYEVQKFVIVFPELTLVAVFVLNIVVGKYTGLRVSEFFRFKPIIDPEE